MYITKDTGEIKMKKKKDEKGITLVTLVVTIVVLIILAGISISALSGKNGLLQYLSAGQYWNAIPVYILEYTIPRT